MSQVSNPAPVLWFPALWVINSVLIGQPVVPGRKPGLARARGHQRLRRRPDVIGTPSGDGVDQHSASRVLTMVLPLRR